jgi:SOS-response transcriptional repressor LexA
MDNKTVTLRETIGNRITEARKQVGITIKELAARTGSLSPARISNWEQGTRSPGPLEAKQLSEHLNVSASYLLCLTDNLEGELVQRMDGGLHHVPVLGLADARYVKEILNAGENTTAHKSIVVDGFNKSRESACLFAVLVEDSSMQPAFNAGDLVIVDGELSVKPGDYVLAYLSSKQQTVLRKYGEADGCLFQLLTSNDLWATIVIQQQSDVEICGVVVEVRKYLRKSSA